MSIQYRTFRSKFKSWDDLFVEASEFASSVGKERLVSISHSCDDRREGVVTVWFWAGELT